MNNYKITFERSNGTKGNDIFTELTRHDATESFHAVYRHDIYKIISIEIQ